MAQYLIITRPEYDYATRYLSAWAESFFEAAKDKGYSVIDLHHKRANRKEFESILRKKTPNFVIVNGHGNDNAVSGHENEPLLIAGDNSSLLKGKITYAISCRSARKLGKEVGQYIDTAYIGYEDDFIFIYLEKHRSRPLEDKLAGLFLDPSNLVATTLLKGHPAKEAVLRAQKEFLRKIQELLLSEISTDKSSALRWLVWDMKHLTLCGDENKKL